MTFVEEFIIDVGGPTKVKHALEPIEHFFSQPYPRAALRLCCIGLSGKRGNDNPSWAPLNKLANRLFEGEKDKDRIVDGHKIKRFAYNLNDQREPEKLHAYIGLLVSHMLAATPLLKKEGPVADGLAIFDFFSALQDYCKTREMKHLNSVPLAVKLDLERAIAAVPTPTPTTGIRTALGIGKQDLRETGQRFFRETGRVFDKESYYACYRYSMSEIEVVKTFLILRSPTKNTPYFGFRHVYHFESDGGSFVTKVADGEIVRLDGAFYFLGASKPQMRAKTGRTQGLKLIAVPEHSLVPEPRLLSGLFMSASLRGEPIVGRLALLHLGFSFNGIVEEAQVKPRVIKTQADFSNDLIEMSKLGHGTALPQVEKLVPRIISNEEASVHKDGWTIHRAIRAISSNNNQG